MHIILVIMQIALSISLTAREWFVCRCMSELERLQEPLLQQNCPLASTVKLHLKDR